jgi:hypothetical protein
MMEDTMMLENREACHASGNEWGFCLSIRIFLQANLSERETIRGLFSFSPVFCIKAHDQQ